MTLQCTTTDRIRWSDVDPAGVVYYSRVFRFFDGAEEELFRSAGLASKDLLARHSILLPRISVTLQLRRPLRLGDCVTSHARVLRIRRSHLLLGFELIRNSDGVRAATGKTLISCVDKDTFTVTALPRSIVAALTDDANALGQGV